jgi:hypothetical protein
MDLHVTLLHEELIELLEAQPGVRRVQVESLG